MNIQKCFLIVYKDSKCDFHKPGPDTWHMNHVATWPGSSAKDRADLLDTIHRFFTEDYSPQPLKAPFVSGAASESGLKHNTFDWDRPAEEAMADLMGQMITHAKKVAARDAAATEKPGAAILDEVLQSASVPHEVLDRYAKDFGPKPVRTGDIEAWEKEPLVDDEPGELP